MNIYISDVGIFKSDTSSYPNVNTASVSKIKPLNETNHSTDSVARQAQKAYVAENTPAYTISISSMGKAAVQSMKLTSAAFTENLRASLAKNADQNTTIFGLNNTQNNFAHPVTDDSTASKNSLKDDEGAGRNSTFNVTAPVGTASPAASDTNTVITSEEESSVNSSVTGNLGRYTEYQLQQLLDDGSITRAEYNSELSKRADAVEAEPTAAEVETQAIQDPVMSQAIAAYNYQMSYQINALVTQ